MLVRVKDDLGVRNASGSALRRIRRDKDITLQDASNHMSRVRQEVYHLESGVYRFKPGQLGRFAVFLEVPLCDLANFSLELDRLSLFHELGLYNINEAKQKMEQAVETFHQNYLGQRRAA